MKEIKNTRPGYIRLLSSKSTAYIFFAEHLRIFHLLSFFDFVESDFSEKNVSIRHVTELYMGPSTVLERRVLAEVVYRNIISYISATEDF